MSTTVLYLYYRWRFTRQTIVVVCGVRQDHYYYYVFLVWALILVCFTGMCTAVRVVILKAKHCAFGRFVLVGWDLSLVAKRATEIGKPTCLVYFRCPVSFANDAFSFCIETPPSCIWHMGTPSPFECAPSPAEHVPFAHDNTFFLEAKRITLPFAWGWNGDAEHDASE